jgi:hypothetical protein
VSAAAGPCFRGAVHADAKIQVGSAIAFDPDLAVKFAEQFDAFDGDPDVFAVRHA